jgi:cation diffusion facilitator CzcD-associated flavoprotein CzcO
MSTAHEALDALHAKYAAERARRLRADGVAQYRELKDAFGAFDRDPYTPFVAREPVFEEIEVAIVGAGIGGMLAAAHLVKQGVDGFRVIDKAGDFGGTWYWNRYPGAACDVVSYIYMPLLEETGYMPVEKYSKAPEIFAHCQRIARHFDLYPRSLFQTEVSSLDWDEAARRWRVGTDRGDRLMARFVITAGGVLHKAKLPGIPGMEDFKGHAFHTSRWDYAYTGGAPTTPMDRLGDKRVALIGTGATTVQALPKLAEAAGQVIVFQRTPSGVGVRANQPTDPDWVAALKPGWQRAQIDNFTRIVSGKPVEEDLIQDGWSEIFLRNPAVMGVMNDEQLRLDAENMAAIHRRIEDIVEDPETAEALKPWYHQLCKRPCFHDEYLPTFNRPNVTLVDTQGRGVERITEDAVVAGGVAYPVDCIIYASGFEAGGSHARTMNFEIHGRGGVSLTEAWAGGPATLHGLFARGFPNLIRFSTTQGGMAINVAHLLDELAEHSAWFIRRCLDEGIEEVEPTAAAQDAWFGTLMANMSSLGAFYAACTPSYMNGEGSRVSDPSALRYMPFYGGTQEYLDILGAWRAAGGRAGLETRRAGADSAALRVPA